MRKDIQALIDASKDKAYSKLTDKQLEQYSNNEHYKNGAKLGGHIVGNRIESKLRLKKLQKTACILGGKVMGAIQGKKNIESGLISNLGKIQANKIHKCPHCNKIGKSSSMFQWHFDKCKWKNNPKPIPEKKIPINEQIHTCKHCLKTIKGRNYFRWHGDNCKMKK
jgi:hypothetical protein